MEREYFVGREEGGRGGGEILVEDIQILTPWRGKVQRFSRMYDSLRRGQDGVGRTIITPGILLELHIHTEREREKKNK